MATTENVQKTETRTTTVSSGGDAAATNREADDIMDGMGAFLEKKGINLETGERTAPVVETPPARERKEHAPATAEQKKELESMLSEGQPTKAKEPKAEVKAEVKTEVKTDPKTDQKVEQKKPDFRDLSDEGINREVNDLKTGKQETKDRYASLLRELKQQRETGDLTKKEFDSAREELAKVKKDYEEASKRPVIPEDVVKQQQAEKEELSMFRRQYQLEKDPEVKKAFDDQVLAVEDTIQKSLADVGVPPKALELIKNTGGWAAFSKSKEPISWTETDADTGEPNTVRGTHALYARKITEALDPNDSAAIQARVGKQALIRDQKDQYIANERSRAGEFFKKLDEQTRNASEAQKKTVEKLKADYVAWADKIGNESEWLKDRVVPKDATKEEKAEIESENAHNAEVRNYVKRGQSATSFEEFTKFVEQGARGLKAELRYKPLETKATALQARVKELEDELVKVRNGNRSVTSKGSITGAGAVQQEGSRKKSAENVDDILADLDRFASDKG